MRPLPRLLRVLGDALWIGQTVLLWTVVGLCALLAGPVAATVFDRSSLGIYVWPALWPLYRATTQPSEETP